MTITLPLEPQKEAKRIGLARQRSLSADELVREAIDKILTAAPDQTIKPKKSAYWLLAQWVRQTRKSTKTAGRCSAASATTRGTRDRCWIALAIFCLVPLG
jgi:hypothetical protein